MIKSLRDSLEIFEVDLEGFLPIEMKTEISHKFPLFWHVYDVFDPNFGHFLTFRPDWKLLTFVKQKWKRFVKENAKKWKMTPFYSIWPFVFAVEMKTVF